MNDDNGDDLSALMSWTTIDSSNRSSTSRAPIDIREAITGHLVPVFGRNALAVTLNFNRPTTLNGGRSLIGRWLAMTDRHFLGSSFKKYPAQRITLIAIPEHIHSNLHYHAICRPPIRRNDSGQVSMEDFQTDAADVWRYLVPSGSLDTRPMHHERGWANYITKTVPRNLAWEHAVLSFEFHPGK